ncbi:hypothetical protein BU15DRAFT_67739 [Melanogaster broomeanus]|nr:hypothetical protein BU15DRAFT_67739 [Melanogaster broomeanus]
MMRSSRDFEDVKADLNERTNWTIEVTKDNLIASASHMKDTSSHCVRSCGWLWLRACISTMVDSPHISSRSASKIWAMLRFAILIAALDLGIVVIRVAGIFTNVRVTRSSDILAKEPPAHRRTRRDRWCCSWELNFCALQLEQGSDGILR